MPLIPVDDPLDPRLDDYRILSDRELLRARRRFIAEGRLVVRRLLTSSPLDACSVLVTAPALESLADLLPGQYPDLSVFVMPQAAMNAKTRVERRAITVMGILLCLSLTVCGRG